MPLATTIHYHNNSVSIWSKFWLCIVLGLGNKKHKNLVLLPDQHLVLDQSGTQQWRVNQTVDVDFIWDHKHSSGALGVLVFKSTNDLSHHSVFLLPFGYMQLRWLTRCCISFSQSCWALALFHGSRLCFISSKQTKSLVSWSRIQQMNACWSSHISKTPYPVESA